MVNPFSATYQVRNNHTYIVLWSSSGKEEIEARPYAFIEERHRPYLANIATIEATDLYTWDTHRPVVKFIGSQPEDIAQWRDKLANRRIPTYEADIPFVRRWMVDNKIVCSNYPHRAVIDIEVDDATGFPDVSKAENRILSIAISCNGSDIFLYGNEADIIHRLFYELDQNDIYFVMGWNLLQFDLPYIKARASKLGIPIAYKRYRWFDAMIAFKYLHNERRMSLEYIAEHYLGAKKPYVGQRISALTEAQLKERNLWDAQTVFELDKRYNISDVILEIAQQTYLFPDNVLSQAEGHIATMSQPIDNLLLLKARQMGIVLPNKKREKREAYQGALVIMPKHGLYTNVGHVDFDSLYPSIIINERLSPEPERRLIPEIVEELVRNKRLTRDPLKRQAYKILANSFYGAFASPYFRLYNPELAKTVTQKGREILTRSMDWIYSLGFLPLYGDTDSIFIKLDDKLQPEEAMHVLTGLATALTKYWQNRYLVSAQAIWSVLFFPKGATKRDVKKRYAGYIVYKKGKLLPQPELEVVGMELRRTDWCQLAKDVQEQLLRFLLLDKRQEGLNYLYTIIAELKSHKYDNKLILYKGLSKPISAYLAEAQHIKALKNGIKYGTYSEQEALLWREIKYVMTINGPVAIRDLSELRLPLDYNWYIKRQILPVAQRLGYEVQAARISALDHFF